ncbi:MAG TPA: hypothetical protein VNN17_05715 [Terriglobia bacterium]|nr:hypothetical protein [Terriglobia bacterium]
MKRNRWFLAVFFVLWLVPAGVADQVELKDGTRLEGIVQKVEKGQVTILTGSETRVIDILDIVSMEFDTARLTSGTERLPLEHFLGSMEAQEMLGHFQAVEQAAENVRRLIDRTKEEWADQKSIAFDETAKWATAKERFRKPLAEYQEALNELYFHVLGKVDQYNDLMKQADSIYVGVKGWFQAGSSLIPPSMKKLPLKKYVPANWYDTIFYEGYNQGYNDAYEKYGERF